MEPARQLRRVFPVSEQEDEEDCSNLVDEGDDDDGSSLTDASDLSSFDWDEVADVNLNSLMPLNSAATMLEAAVVEEGAAEFLQAAPEQVADIRCEFSDALLVADSVMHVTAVESRTCWPLEMVQSSSAAVLLRAPPGRRHTVVIVPPSARPAASVAEVSDGDVPVLASAQAAPEIIDLMARLTQPKRVPHNPEMHTVELLRRPPPNPARPTALGRIADAAMSATGLHFHPAGLPAMSRCEKVPYLHGFTFGDTYQLQEKLWLLPQLVCGALVLTGILLTLVGIIMLQINKYLVALCATQSEGLQCRTDEESITSVTMSIGIGTAGGGLSLILICGIVFLHAFCVIYDEGEHHKAKNQENISLHVPTAAYRINLSDLTSSAGQPQPQPQQQEAASSQQQQQQQQQPELQQQQQPQKQQPEQDQKQRTNSPPTSGPVRWQSFYDNLNIMDTA